MSTIEGGVYPPDGRGDFLEGAISKIDRGRVNFVIESEIPPSTRGVENVIELTVGRGIIENMTKKLVKPVPPFKKKGQKMVPRRKKGKKCTSPLKKWSKKMVNFVPPPGGRQFCNRI